MYIIQKYTCKLFSSGLGITRISQREIRKTATRPILLRRAAALVADIQQFSAARYCFYGAGLVELNP